MDLIFKILSYFKSPWGKEERESITREQERRIGDV